MKKEVIIAVLIGLTMGLVITYGVYRVRSSVSGPKVIEVGEEKPSTPEATPAVLALHNPSDGTIQTEKAISITGATYPNTYVVIFINDEEHITTSDETGNFSIDQQLQDGPNTIAIVVVDNNGQTYTERRTVIVSGLFDEPAPSASASSKPTQKDAQ